MKVLIIDDDIKIIEMVKLGLENDGMNVISASNGKDGVETAIKEKPDLILMDWMLPKMSGIDAIKILKNDKTVNDIPIFMLTARSQVSDVDKAFKSGADNYITKPFDPMKLGLVIKEKLKKLKRR